MKYIDVLKESAVNEFKWPFKRKPKPVKPQAPDAALWKIFEEILMLYYKALDNFGNKIAAHVKKAEGDPKGNDYDYIEDIDMYKKYKPVYERYYKQALANLIRTLPAIKDKWKEAIEEWKTLPPDKKRYHQDRIKNYVKHMKVNNRKLAVDMIGYKGFVDANPDAIAPDFEYEDSQTYSYAVIDYG